MDDLHLAVIDDDFRLACSALLSEISELEHMSAGLPDSIVGNLRAMAAERRAAHERLTDAHTKALLPIQGRPGVDS